MPMKRMHVLLDRRHQVLLLFLVDVHPSTWLTRRVSAVGEVSTASFNAVLRIV